MMVLRAHPFARRELRDAIEYHEAERPGRGLQLAMEVDRVFQRVQILPRAAPRWLPPIDDYEVRRANLVRYPYFVVYSVHRDYLLVVAIAHSKRRPEYWIDRLRGKPQP